MLRTCAVRKTNDQKFTGYTRNCERRKPSERTEAKLQEKKVLNIDKRHEEVKRMWKRQDMNGRKTHEQNRSRFYKEGTKSYGVYKRLSNLIKEKVSQRLGSGKAEWLRNLPGSNTNVSGEGNFAVLSTNLINISLNCFGGKVVQDPCIESTERSSKRVKDVPPVVVRDQRGNDSLKSVCLTKTRSVATQCTSHKPTDSLRGNTHQDRNSEESTFPSTAGNLDNHITIVKKVDTVFIRSSSNDLLNVVSIDDCKLISKYKTIIEADSSSYSSNCGDSALGKTSDKGTSLFYRRCCVTPCRDPVVPAINGVVPMRSCVDRALSIARANKESSVIRSNRPKSAPTGSNKVSSTFSRLNSGLRKHVTAVVSAKGTLNLLPANDRKQALDILGNVDDPITQRESMRRLFQSSVEKRLNIAATDYSEERLAVVISR